MALRCRAMSKSNRSFDTDTQRLQGATGEDGTVDKPKGLRTASAADSGANRAPTNGACVACERKSAGMSRRALRAAATAGVLSTFPSIAHAHDFSWYRLLLLWLLLCKVFR